MWKHVWKGFWWKHFYATNACSLSSNSLLFPPPFSVPVLIFVFLCFSCFCTVHKFSWGTEHSSNRWHVFLSLAAHDNSPLSKWAHRKQDTSFPVHARKGKRLALITSRQKTPLTNKQTRSQKSFLTHREHTQNYKKCYSSLDQKRFWHCKK